MHRRIIPLTLVIVFLTLFCLSHQAYVRISGCLREPDSLGYALINIRSKRLCFNKSMLQSIQNVLDEAKTQSDIKIGLSNLYPPISFKKREAIYPNCYNGGVIIEGENPYVRAVFDGDVVFSSFLNGFGNIVVISHRSHMYSIYGFLKERLVNESQEVFKGQPIAYAFNDAKKGRSIIYFELRYGLDKLDLRSSLLQTLKKE